MKLNIAGATCSLPDFLIIGAAKSGTTSLYFYLRQHPRIFMPAETKEPGYLAFMQARRPEQNPAHPYPDLWQSVVTDLDDYASLFTPAGPTQLCGEATPEYQYLASETIANVRALYGDRHRELRLIAVLRNPVERIWSHYWMFVRDGYEQLPIEKAIDEAAIAKRLQAGWHPAYDYLGYGRYAAQLRLFHEAFGRERVCIVLFEDLARDPRATCARIFAFLGVDASFSPDVSTIYNPSGQLRHPRVHAYLFGRESVLKSVARRALPYEALQRLKQRLVAWNTTKVAMPLGIREQLLAYYRNDIRELERIIDRDLSAWLK